MKRTFKYLGALIMAATTTPTDAKPSIPEPKAAPAAK